VITIQTKEGPINILKLSACVHTLKTPNKSVLGGWGKGGSLISSVLGESISIHPGLQLVRGLWTPLEVALLEAPVDTDGKVVRDLKRYAVTT
jgi:hypothetical protein